jgi:DtxR family transcriptional regulator, Mn-dependent transcriptional regulator
MTEYEQPTPTIEDYLSLIYSMDFDQEKINGAKLAEYLGVSAPTVTTTLQRMERDGWIISGDKKALALTEKGKSAALAVVHRHNLVECLLYEVLGMPLSSLHEEAHRIEHAISVETEKYLHQKFVATQFSPFGMPLQNDHAITSTWIPLLQAGIQQPIIIRRIIHYYCTREALEFLEAHYLSPGTAVQVIQHQEFTQTITIRLQENRHEITLGYPIARMIQVECQ